MNATNRGVNRVILCFAGVLLIAVGGAAALSVLWPAAGDAWTRWSQAGLEFMTGADADTRISEATTVSWFTLAVLALLVLVVVIAMVVIAKLGGGRSSVVLREEAGEGVLGAVTVRQEFVADVLTHSLSSRDEFLAVRVNTRRLRGTDVLHVGVTPRQNLSPVEVASTVDELVEHLEALLGRETPTLVTIHSGIRSKLAAEQSRVS